MIADFTSFQLASAPNNAFSYNEVCEDLARWNFPRSFFFFASKPNYTFSSVYLCTQACTDTGGGSGQLVAYINLRHVGAIRT